MEEQFRPKETVGGSSPSRGTNMSAIALNRTFEFNPESGQKHENPAKIPRELLSAPNSPSTAQDKFEFIDSCLPETAKRNWDCQMNHADDLWAHNPEVAGSNPVPATD